MRWTALALVPLLGCPGADTPVDTDTLDDSNVEDTDTTVVDTDTRPDTSGETGAPDTSTTGERALGPTAWCAAAGVATDGTGPRGRTRRRASDWPRQPPGVGNGSTARAHLPYEVVTTFGDEV